MSARKLLLPLGALALIAAAAFVVPTVWLRPWSIDHFYARVFIEFTLRHPMILTGIGLPGLDLEAGRLDDFSVAAQDREAAWLERQVQYLRSYDRSGMSPDRRISAEVLDWFLSDRQEGNRFRFMDYPVNQSFGIQSELPSFMMTIHPLRGPRDAENYLRRIAGFGVAFDQVLEGLRKRESTGVIPPRFVIERVLTQTRAFVAGAPTANPLYTSFQTRIGKAHGVGAAARAKLLARLEQEIREVVYPAYGRLNDYLAALQGKALNLDGVWALPNGENYYAHLLRSHTTTEMSADEIHALGLAEVARIQGEMRAILKSQGIGARDLGAAVRALGEEPRFLYAATDSGRKQLLADYQAILDDAQRRLPALFDERPRARLAVQPVPAFKQATSAAAYYEPGSMDGSRPGTFFVNVRDPRENPRWGMRTLAYHEGIPGHHFQLSIAQELQGVPMFRRVVPFTAYTEGWALYAEQLALEQHFETDPIDRLGALNAELFRAARLVVDTGIHRKRWTREQAIDYMARTTGVPESKVVSEVERYIVTPGQACAYKVGELKIMELRRRAMERLGPRFDLKAFHRVVLDHGAVPLTILERLVEDWIRSVEQAPRAAAPQPPAVAAPDAPRS